MEQAAFLPPDLLAQMAPHLGLIGSPDDIVAKLEMLSRAGIREVFMQTIGTMQFPEAELQAFQRVIGPAAHALP